MRKFIIDMTMSYDFQVTIEAESEEEAKAKAEGTGTRNVHFYGRVERDWTCHGCS